MQKRTLAVLIAALSLPFAIQPGVAAEHHGGPGHGGPGGGYHGQGHYRDLQRSHHPVFRGDIHRFREHDLGIWHGGRWYHGPHGGRRGWWWIVGGLWYFYPAPVYPYPDPYLPPVEAPPPASSAYWYYCNDPPGYYPYVGECRTEWQPVSPNAPPPPPQ